MEEDIKIIRESQIRMEADIKHHIARTDKLEDMVVPMWKMFSSMRWNIKAVMVLGGLAGAVFAISKFV